MVIPDDMIIEVDGKRVFTANWVMAQMSALMSSNERARAYGKAGIIIGLVASLLSVSALVLVLVLG